MEALTPAKPQMSEFVTKLIDETMEAIVASQASQFKRQNEIKEAILLPLSEFSDTYISISEIEEEIISIFKGHGLSKDKVFIYEAWQHELDQLNIDLQYEQDIRKDRLTDTGILKIKKAVKLSLGIGKQFLLQQILKQGIPRIQIDGGEISAKVTLDTYQKEKPLAGNIKKMSSNERLMQESEKILFVSKRYSNNGADQINPIQISVTGAIAGSKNEYSEIKLQFKTVYE